MDYLDAHHANMYCHNKNYTCLDEEGNQVTIKGIPRPISLRQIIALQLKKCLRKGCQLYAIHVEESKEGKDPELQYYPILQNFADIF